MEVFGVGWSTGELGSLYGRRGSPGRGRGGRWTYQIHSTDRVAGYCVTKVECVDMVMVDS